jgi:hypothetical protein
MRAGLGAPFIFHLPHLQFVPEGARNRPLFDFFMLCGVDGRLIFPAAGIGPS